MKPLKFDVFGRDLLIVETGGRWEVFYSGSKGKRRPANDIVVPADIEE